MFLFKTGMAAAIILFGVGSAYAGRIIVNHDEWTFSSTGYSSAGAANADQFAANVLDFLSNGAGTDVLVYSDNTLLTNTDFDNSANAAGYTLTKGTASPFTLANLSLYDVVVLGGYYLNAAEVTDLTAYVNNGGGVYLAGGSGVGGPAVEAAAWNPFLNTFGFSFAPVYNGVIGTLAVNQSHPVESGVSQLYYNNGNTISLVGANPYASIIESSGGGAGLLGVYDDVGATAVPEPSMYTMLGAGLGLILFARVRR